LVALTSLLLLVGCGGPVDVPPDAPLQRADCGWPESTEMAFAGWSTPYKLRIAELEEVPGNPGQIYALVTRKGVVLTDEAGPPTRQFCARSIDGNIHQGVVADDWRPPVDSAP
jgi:hypothetical protein